VSSAVAEMGDHFAITNMGRKEGGCCASFQGENSIVICDNDDNELEPINIVDDDDESILSK